MNLIKLVNVDTAEVKFFASRISARLFMRKNNSWRTL